MSKATSVFLDALRIVAAYGVFFCHCNLLWFKSENAFFSFFATFGHQFVIVFFVLSGYVIAHSTWSRAQSPGQYVAARLSRLYSVVFPALCVTEFCRHLVMKLRPESYAMFDRGHDALRWLLSLFFLQEVWFQSATPPTNGPLWSLGYEFWYYALFGVAVFAKSIRAKSILCLLVALLVGPKVMLLFPIWLMGVITYFLLRGTKLPSRLALLGFFVSLTMTVTLILSDWQFPRAMFVQQLCYSSHFVSDFALGLAISLTIFLFESSFGQVDVPRRLEIGMRGVADTTFSLYVFHYPLLVLGAAFLSTKSRGSCEACLLPLAVVLVVILLSRITEAKKYFLRNKLLLIGRKFSGIAGSPVVSGVNVS